MIGKSWPKDAVTKDGIVCLSGNCVKKLLSEIEVYLEKNKLRLHKKLFYQMCGFQAFRDRQAEALKNKSLLSECKQDVISRIDTDTVELLPSDRPEEITIVTLKRFECIDVPDVEESEDEEIENEDKYFTKETITLPLESDVSMKPGYTAKVKLLLPDSFTLDEENLIVCFLIFKNDDFGNGNTEESARSGFKVDRQVVEISGKEKINDDNNLK